MKRDPNDAAEDAEQPPSGAELVQRLQRTLGIAIVIESVESAESGQPDDPGGSGAPVTIHAAFMSGRYTKQVVVGGPTESDAWAALARAAIAWRNSDFQHIEMWLGGG